MPRRQFWDLAYCFLAIGMFLPLLAALGMEPVSRPVAPTQVAWNSTDQTFEVRGTGTAAKYAIDPATGKMVRQGRRPEAGLISPVGFVASANRAERTVLIDPWQARLLVAARPVSQLGTATQADCRQIPLGPDANPQGVAITADGRTAVVACDTPGADDRTLAVFALESGTVERRAIPGSSNLRGVAIDPEGKYALAVHLRPKSHLPSTQIEQGWIFTNAVSYVSLTGPERVVSLPLDLRTQGFANPEGVVIDGAGRWAYVAHAGADVVSVIDLDAMRKLVAESDENAAGAGAGPGPATHRGDDLRLTRKYVRERIPVGANPRGLALSDDGTLLAVANRLGDSVSLIDTKTRKVLRTVALSDAPADNARRGEILFHSGKLAYGAQFSCASCHPDGRSDGLNWDLPADGFNNFHNTKNLLSATGTQPYGWLGESATLRERFTGTLRHLFQYEPQPGDVEAIEAYLSQLSYPNWVPRRVEPNSETAARGKKVFEGTAGCANCHRGPMLTDQKSHDVGTGASAGSAPYDTPSLVRVSETAPYLHDGRARTLEEIFTKYNPTGAHGAAAELSPDQLRDLLDYLRSL